MKPVDIIITVIIAAIVGAASYYIYRAKKNGKGCIGCPDSANCQKYNESVNSCGGNCSFCTSCHSDNGKKTKE